MVFDTSSLHLLLSDEEEYSLKTCPHCERESLKKPLSRRLRFRVVLFVIYSMATIFMIIGMASVFTSIRYRSLSSAKQVESNREPSLYSPFTTGIRYEIETTPPDYWDSHLYMGEPSEESEQAWNKLIHPGREHGIRLLREEAALLNINKSILLPDNNFAVILGVHHNLHCLRRMRQTFFEDHYHPDWTNEDRKRNRDHNLHCLESIRTSITCQPDLAPMPYYWSGNEWHEMNASPQVKRECVDFEFFSEYLREERSYNRSELVRDYL